LRRSVASKLTEFRLRFKTMKFKTKTKSSLKTSQSKVSITMHKSSSIVLSHFTPGHED